MFWQLSTIFGMLFGKQIFQIFPSFKKKNSKQHLKYIKNIHILHHEARQKSNIKLINQDYMGIKPEQKTQFLSNILQI